MKRKILRGAVGSSGVLQLNVSFLPGTNPRVIDVRVEQDMQDPALSGDTPGQPGHWNAFFRSNGKIVLNGTKNRFVYVYVTSDEEIGGLAATTETTEPTLDAAPTLPS